MKKEVADVLEEKMFYCFECKNLIKTPAEYTLVESHFCKDRKHWRCQECRKSVTSECVECCREKRAEEISNIFANIRSKVFN